MLEPTPDSPNAERADYDEFYSHVQSYEKECAKTVRNRDGTTECGFGSSTSPLELTFRRTQSGYNFAIEGHFTEIPLEIFGIEDSGLKVHYMEFRIGPKQMFVVGRLVNSKQPPEKWDPGISSLKPDTKSLLPLIKRTSPRHRKKPRIST